MALFMNIENRPSFAGSVETNIKAAWERVYVMIGVPVRLGSVALLIIMLNAALDQGSRSVSAADNTPTSTATPTRTATAIFTPTVTVTPTSTPDALDQRKIEVNKTATALAKDKEVAELEARNAATQRQIDALRTPVPPAATPDPDMITINRRDFDTVIKTGVDTALAARPTATPLVIRERVVERVVEERSGDGVGIPGILWLGLAAVGGGLAIARRNQIRDLVIQSGAPNWRVTNWVRTHGGNRVVQSAPVQFVWRQARRLYGI